MNRASTAFVTAPSELLRTLCWIDDLLAKDREITRATLEDVHFSAELIKLNRMVQQAAFEEARELLDAVLEKFAILQAIAFKSRLSKP